MLVVAPIEIAPQQPPTNATPEAIAACQARLVNPSAQEFEDCLRSSQPIHKRPWFWFVAVGTVLALGAGTFVVIRSR